MTMLALCSGIWITECQEMSWNAQSDRRCCSARWRFCPGSADFTAIARQQYGEAAQDHERAIAIRPQSRTLLDEIQALQ
jgi:hypothetical protein